MSPEVQQSARLVVNLSAAAGAPVRVTQGLRTYEEQDALYAQGRTSAGPRVTNAQGGQSYHNFGLAMDLAPVVDGSADPTRAPESVTIEIAKSQGWEWGGDFSGFKDRPHFQKPNGKSLKQLRDARK